jgi:Carboxypeptidase regulatory-like domain
MRISAVTLAVLAIFLTSSFPAARLVGQSPEPDHATGVIRGVVTDASGGVLPGVSVMATSAEDQVLATATTDGSGMYVLRGLPAGAVTLAFQLDGFADVNSPATVEPGEELHRVERLRLASLSETVDVHAASPADAPRPRFAPPPPEPPLVAKPLPEHDRAAVCGPAKPDPISESLGTIKSRRHETQGELYLEGAELVINGGLEEGLLVGRNLVVRRHYHARGASGTDTLAEHSAGVVQIVAATEHTSVGLVIYACDAIRKGDFLATFRPEPVRHPEPPGLPAYRDAARILFADDGQTLGVPERKMVIDRGAKKGIHVGQRLTLFRQPGGAVKNVPVGDAIVVSVKDDSATIQIERVTDAFGAGDWAAPQSASTAVALRR